MIRLKIMDDVGTETIWVFANWREADGAFYVDRFGRTRVSSELTLYGDTEPLVHNPNGPAIECDGESGLYFLDGERVSENQWSAIRKPLVIKTKEPDRGSIGSSLAASAVTLMAVSVAGNIMERAAKSFIVVKEQISHEA